MFFVFRMNDNNVKLRHFCSESLTHPFVTFSSCKNEYIAVKDIVLRDKNNTQFHVFIFHLFTDRLIYFPFPLRTYNTFFFLSSFVFYVSL